MRETVREEHPPGWRGWHDAGASFDEARVYRYSLWRAWDASGPTVCWCMLNPSTADENVEDPTIRRCIGFARAWGFGAIAIVNLFALRSTDPRWIYQHGTPIGPRNDDAIVEAASIAKLVIAAWGAHGAYLGRGAAVLRLLRPRVQVHCLGVTKQGHPRHPLYLRGDLQPELMP